LPDKVYFEWQKYLLDQFETLLLKPHPKNRVNYDFPISRQMSGCLEKCVQKSDVIFIDSLGTTAFAIIASSSKPIIYFNIGIGNLTKNAEKSIRERVIWIDIDLTDPGGLCVKVENQNNKKCVNNYTKQFSLANHNQTREETVLKTIQKIVA
jgi:hypothetical protein